MTELMEAIKRGTYRAPAPRRPAAARADRLASDAAPAGPDTRPAPPRAFDRRPILTTIALVLLAVLAGSRLLPAGPLTPPPIFGTPRQLTFSGDANAPALSPDGRIVAYNNDSGLYMLVVAGGEAIRIPTDSLSSRVGSPLWSADGSEIRFLIEPRGSSLEAWYAVSPVGGRVRGSRRASRTPGSTTGRPTFPGLEITGSGPASPSGPTRPPRHAHLSFGLLSGPLPAGCLSGRAMGCGHGDAARFHGDRPLVATGESGARSHDRWQSASLERQRPHHLRALPEPGAHDARHHSSTGAVTNAPREEFADPGMTEYSYAAGRRRLVYVRDHTRGEVALLAAPAEGPNDTLSLKSLTIGTASYSFPVISPDGNTVAYIREIGHAYDLYLQHVPAGAPVRATYFAPAYRLLQNPQWSPDGARVVVRRRRQRDRAGGVRCRIRCDAAGGTSHSRVAGTCSIPSRGAAVAAAS